MGNQDKKQQSAVEMQEITQSVESPTSGQPTPSTPLPTPTRTPVFTYSDKGLVNTPPFDMGTSPWKLEFSANWSGHFAVQLRSNSIDLVINQNVTAGEIYKTYIYGHMGSNLHFSIVAAPPDGLWTLSVIAVT